MHARSASAGYRFFLLAVLLVLGGLAVGTSSGQTGKTEKPGKDEKADNKTEPKKEEVKQKTVKFTVAGKPWKTVFEWLADLTGKPVITAFIPTGSFTFVGQENKEYTIPQVIDILNEALLSASATNKYYLINRERSFTLAPADEKIDPVLLPRVRRDDLIKHGDTELVSLVLPLTVLVADDVAPQIKKMMGPFGEIVPMTHTGVNNLIMIDTVGNLRYICEMVDTIEKDAGKNDSFRKQLEYVRVRDMESILHNVLGDPRVLVAQSMDSSSGRDLGLPSMRFGRGSDPSSRFGRGFDPSGDPSSRFGRGFDPSGEFGSPFGDRGFDPRFDRSDPRADRGTDPRSRLSPSSGPVNLKRMHTIAVDEATNTILVQGPTDKVALAKKTILETDVLSAANPVKVVIGQPFMKVYTLLNGNAAEIAKSLQNHFREATSITVQAAGTSTLIVYAPPADQVDIAKMIYGDDNKPKAQIVDAGAQDAGKLADRLRAAFGDQKTSGLFIDADTEQNQIILRGAPELVADAMTLIRVISGGGSANADAKFRVFTLDKGGASALADVIEDQLKRRGNPVRIQDPLEALRNPSKQPAPQPQPQPQPPQSRPMQPPKPDDGAAHLHGDSATQYVAYRDEKQPEKQAEKPPESGKAPVTITPVGNKLIVSSDDPVALKVAQEIVSMYTRSNPEGDFKVIHLKYANASDAAKLLDEAFNGKPQPQQGGRGFGGGFGFGGGGFGGPGFNTPQTTTTATNAVVRIVADPVTNSLLVRASPLDMLRIERLLATSIDTDENESENIVMTHIKGPLQYVTAVDVAQVLRDVYRDQTGSNASSGSAGGFRGSRFGGMSSTGTDSSGIARPTALSIGIDDRTNSLVLACSERLYKDINKLIDDLEERAKGSPRTIRIVNIKGVDPSLLAQAIDAIQGTSSNVRRPSSNGPGGPGGYGGNQVGYGGGGYGGGGTGGYGGGGYGGGGYGGPGGGGGFGGPGGGGRGGFGGPGGGGFGGPGGGGGFGGPGGGGRGGFGGGGGGYGGGGGGGRGGRGGPGGATSQAPQEGSPFFADRVTDDPKLALLYDPQQDNATSDNNLNLGATSNDSGALQPVNYQEQPMQPPIVTDNVQAPKQAVAIEALTELGVIVVRANSPADAEAVEKLIELIRKLSADSEVDIKMVPLENADATVVANTLTQLFQRVIVLAGGNAAQLAAPRQTQTTSVFGAQLQTLNQPSSVGLFPLPRMNAILVAAPRGRMEYVVNQIKLLDIGNIQNQQLQPFKLKQAGAARVAQLLNLFWSTRYPNEVGGQHQIRITFDDTTNTVFVQAAPADLVEIADMIKFLDTENPSPKNELRLIPLQYATADDLAQLLLKVISDSLVTPTSPATVQPLTTTPTAGATGFGAGGTPAANAALTTPGARLTGGPGGTASATTKTTGATFVTADGRPVEAGLLEDIHITADPRTNTLLISAPKQAMDLIVTMAREMDAIRPLRAEIRVFQLKKGDAVSMVNTLQQLFQSAAISATGAAPPRPAGFGPGAPAATTVTPNPLAQNPIIDLRLSYDIITNSIIAAGSAPDLVTVESLILRLESSGYDGRKNEVYLLRNSLAADAANTLTTYFNNAIAVLKTTGVINAAQDAEREIVIVPEPITNKLMISVTPHWYPEVIRLIQELDADIPQVVIQVLVAEVDLTGNEEFGVEIGLQTPVLFNRSIYPATGFTGTGFTSSFTNTTTGTPSASLVQVPPGASVSGTTNPVSILGFLFNNGVTAPLPLGNNVVVSPGVVGYQGITNLGVGRVSPTAGVGGLVFSASSDTFSLLVRALKQQGRIDILSRPQVQTLDNQSARVFVGQSYPIIQGSTITSTGFAQAAVTYEPVGVELLVTPKIYPDGRILMRVTPTVSSPQTTTVSVGSGIFAVAVNQQTVDTTVVAQDGETVAIGGLITKRDDKSENKVPWLGDLPWVGAAFRYRTQSKAKSELMVIMTPHIVRNKEEADAILGQESHRMDWIVGDVIRTHGTTGYEPIIPTPPAATPPGPMPPLSGAASPAPISSPLEPLPAPPPSVPQPLSMPKTMPPPPPQPPAPPVTPQPQPQQSFVPPQLQTQPQPQPQVQPPSFVQQPQVQQQNYVTQPQPPVQPLHVAPSQSLPPLPPQTFAPPAPPPLSPQPSMVVRPVPSVGQQP